MGNKFPIFNPNEPPIDDGSPRCNIFCSTFLGGAKKVKKNWRKEFRISCKTLEPEYDWPVILCDLLSELTDRTHEIAFKNEAVSYLMMKKEKETPNNNPILINKETTDFFAKEEQPKEPNETSQEKSFENFISFQNMKSKKPVNVSPQPVSSKEQLMAMEDSGQIIERGISSINNGLSSLNVSNQWNVQSFPQTFVIYQNYDVLESKERTISKFSEKKLWLKDRTQIALQKYNTLAALIEKHLMDPKHPLTAIKNEYLQYFVRLNQKNTIVRESKSSKNEDYHKEIRFMTRDIKSFVWILKEALANFYELEFITKKYRTNEFDLFSDYNMITFIYSLVFTDEVYSIFFESLKCAEKYKEIIYKRNIDLLHNSPPEKFLVQDKFCLNQRTAEFFSKRNLESKTSVSFQLQNESQNVGKKEVKTKKINYVELQNRIFPHLLMNSFNKNEFVVGNKSERNSKKPNYKSSPKPYSDSIDLLKNLQFLKSPAHKIKAITQSFDRIEDTIRDYYEEYGYDERYIVMEPEDFIAIIIYIMSQVSLGHMVTHCNFIELFFNETNLSSKSACYLYSLKTGIEYMLNAIDEND